MITLDIFPDITEAGILLEPHSFDQELKRVHTFESLVFPCQRH